MRKLNSVSKIREYYWVLISIGTVIGLIALLCPTASAEFYDLYGNISESWDLWMIGYSRYYWHETGTVVIWADTIALKTVNLISFVMIIIILVLSLLFSLAMRKQKSSYFFLLSGFAITGLGIYYMVGINFELSQFWDLMTPNFGIIGIFLSSTLILVGFGVGFTDFGKARESIHISTEGMTTYGPQVIPPATSASKLPTSVNFCPECGVKITNTTQKYCINCGIEIEKFKPLE